MKEERLSNLDLLERRVGRVLELRGQIIENLSRSRRGYIHVVIGNKSRPWSALILWADGIWSVKLGDDGYPVKNPSLDLLLEKYASLRHPDFQDIEEQYERKRSRIIKSGEWDLPQLAQPDQDFERAKAKYVEVNRLELLQGLIHSMEEASKSLVK